MLSRKKIIGIVIILIISAAGVYKYQDGKTKTASKQIDAPTDDFFVITGSGTIKSSNTFQVAPVVNGKITKIFFKEGDKLKANDLMFEIDSSDAEMNIKKISNALEQAKLVLRNDLNQVGYLNITAPFNGQVSNILVKKGDVIVQGAHVLTLTDRSKLKLTVPFNYAQINQMQLGHKAEVYINNINQVVTGAVAYINPNSNSNTTEQFAKLFNVEILIDNPGALKEGQYANAVIDTDSGKISSPQNGVLTYANSVVIQSNSAGQVGNIDLKEDQYVKQGSVLMTLSNNTVTASIEADNLKIQDIQTQLDYAKKQIEDYKIYAPMDGTITKQDKKVSELVRTGDVISSLADLEHMDLVVDIDDTDIANIKLGQKASTKVDALSETSSKPLELEITKIPIEGSTLNGITTYPVTLSIDNTPSIKIGMNATIEIKIDKK